MKLRKRRKFTNHKKRIMYFSLFFMLLFISIGYAYLSAALSINGNTTIAANTWDIHFENLSITNGSVIATTPAAEPIMSKLPPTPAVNVRRCQNNPSSTK